ncbi:MAG: PQQ-binding-like beta-propeller repeat protein [Clostridiales bacterium]|nr:PQQ-binding-like beta-propeller repeat protein [Clostridiales bacterium]
MLADLPGEDLPGDMTADNPQDEPAEEPGSQEAAAQPEQPQQPAQPQVQATATPMPALTVAAAADQEPGKFRMAETAYKGSKKQSDFNRETPINAQGGELYTYYPGGVFTFRNDGMRQNAAFGTADMPLKQMSIHWQSDLGSLRTDADTLYGLGWTSQPAIIKWSVEVRSGMNINDAKKDTKALKEVIVGALDGKIYFLDLADGQPTRDPIEVGFPLKGSVAVDTFGRPLIAVGQGISKLRNKTGDIGYHFYNLIDQKRALFINGRKTKNQLQHSTNGAFDGTGLFERNSDSFVVGGENGLFYTVKLNTVFDFKNPTTLTLDPEVLYLRSKIARQDNTGVSIEGSPAMYGPYAFVADKHGVLRCIDTTTMKTLWIFDTGDNTDATPALDLNADGSLSLYTGTTVFARSRKAGNAVIRRLDALTGEEIWAKEVKAKYDNLERGGVKASPIVGQQQIGHLVIFTVNLTEEGGAIIAFNKENGQEAWRVPLPGGAISSPVAVYAQDGSARIVQASTDGKLYLMEGATGSLLSTLDLGGAIESSPAVYNDILVVGTGSKDNHKLYGIRLE